MRNGGQDKQMLWSLLDYHNVTATHRITQPNANHANSRNRKRTAFPMHTKLHKKTTLTTHTRARKKWKKSSFPEPCHAVRPGMNDKATETTQHIQRSEIAVMVLTRLPLLAGPTDGERFSGRREREW